MKKKQIADMLDNVVLKTDAEKKALYEKYVPRIINLLESCADVDEINNVSALDAFGKKGAFDNFVRENSFREIETALIKIESGIKDWVRNGRSKAKEAKSGELHAQAVTKEVRRHVEQRKGRDIAWWAFIILFGCGAALTVVFAFLDNFKVIDYGGKAAGASGIIDLAIGVIAFIVERINDKRTTKRMKAADNVVDGKSYENYINITVKNVKNSFNDNKIIYNKPHNGDEENGNGEANKDDE